MTKPRTIVKRFGDRERKLLTKLFRKLGTDNTHEFAAARGRITSLLHEFDKGWSDLIRLLNGGARTIIRADLAGAIAALGSSDPDVGTEARRHLAELLAQHRKTWNDLADELCSSAPAAWASSSSAADPPRFFHGVLRSQPWQWTLVTGVATRPSIKRRPAGATPPTLSCNSRLAGPVPLLCTLH